MQLKNRGMKAKQIYTWLGLAILCVGLLALLRWLQTEPFLSTGTCPAGFNFFTDSQGNSFCCKGPVKNKKCTAETKYSLCGLAPNLPDPRSGQPLPTCDQLVKDMDPSYKFCPSNMPNYVAPGTGSSSWKNGGCSITQAEGDGSLFSMQPGSNTPVSPICLISGSTNISKRREDDTTFQTTSSGQPSCETLKLKETIQCPANTTLIYNKDGPVYMACMINDFDQKKYDLPWCIPDEVLAMNLDRASDTGQPMGLEKATTDCSSCSYYKKKYIDKDTTAKCMYN